MAEHRALLKSTAVTGGITAISRVFGYLRDAVIFIFLGATGSTDAFFVAFRIPNFLRRLFAEGAFSQAFVPVLSEYKEQRSQQELQALINHVAGTLGIILFLVSVLGVLLAPFFIYIFAPGFTSDGTRFDLATQMLRITFPYILFISLTALSASILNTFNRFAVPAFTPVLLNVSLIAATLWLAPGMDQPVIALAWGVFIAGIAQLAFQVPFLSALGVLPRFSLHGARDGVRKIIRLMLPAIFGSSVVQINLLINTLIASFLAVGSISWLYISDRFVELPLAIFGVATATIILPRLSRQYVSRSTREFSLTLDWALRLSILISIPATVGLIMLASPILTSLVQYREFTATDTLMAATSLKAYALGLPAFILIKVLAPGFYSRQDTKTPVKIGVVAMLCNIILNLVFVWIWLRQDLAAPHAALALATSLSAYINAALLFHRLKGSAVLLLPEGWLKYLAQVLVATAVMGLVLVWLLPESVQWVSWGGTTRIIALLGFMLSGAVLYIGALALLGVRRKIFILQQ
ncbi:MAG: murein biosynthesis integral membrane protein MurJ [Gammaproteobacteria bacterium]|nr:murein biosynthesis integral membrane protein MurJ [Gammaproteobacteria bacterium]